MTAVRQLVDALQDTQSEREELYRWLHQHPELSMQERATSARVEALLVEMGFECSTFATTGKVGVLDNGPGPTVMVRADMDALPIAENTGLDYAADPAAGRGHMCGHDMHMAALLGAARSFADNRDEWSGTFIALFQPGEEAGGGAAAMVADGLADALPTPDVVLGQHVLPIDPPLGFGTIAGRMTTAASNWKVTIHGRGGHGSSPETAIDPVVIAASVITRLQTIVARESNPHEPTVVTVGTVHGGQSTNSIPDSVELGINTRAVSDEATTRIVEKLKRIVRAECAAGGAEEDPEFELLDSVPPIINDDEATATVHAALRDHFGDAEVAALEPMGISEDFAILPYAFGAPYCFWGWSGFSAGAHGPSNHSSEFGPQLQPTLDRGTAAIIVAALAWLKKG